MTSLQVQIIRLRRLHGFSEPTARAIAGLHFGEASQ